MIFLESLKAVFSQRLLPRADGTGMALAYELLLGSTQLANLIKDGKTFQIPNIMQMGKAQGLRTMDDSLMELFKTGVISLETAHKNALNTKAFPPLPASGAPAAAPAAAPPAAARPAAPSAAVSGGAPRPPAPPGAAAPRPGVAAAAPRPPAPPGAAPARPPAPGGAVRPAGAPPERAVAGTRHGREERRPGGHAPAPARLGRGWSHPGNLPVQKGQG